MLAVAAALAIGLGGCRLDRAGLFADAGPPGQLPRDSGPVEEVEDAGQPPVLVDAGPPPVPRDAGPPLPQPDAGMLPGTCDGVMPAWGICPEVCTRCNANTCFIDCGGIGGLSGCNNASFTCPTGWACEMNCTGLAGVCSNTTLVCADGPCSATCTGLGTCSNVNVVCGGDACRSSCLAIARPGTVTLIEPQRSCSPVADCL